MENTYSITEHTELEFLLRTLGSKVGRFLMEKNILNESTGILPWKVFSFMQKYGKQVKKAV
jgi:hypothetical protein